MSILPRFLNDRVLPDVGYLLSHVEGAETIHSLIGVFEGVYVLLVFLVGHLDLVEPEVEHTAHRVLLHGGFDSSAVSMAHNDDVVDFQVLYGILNHAVDLGMVEGKYIQVCRYDKVGYVPVDEDLPWIRLSQLIGRHARVGATNEQILGVLPFGKLFEVVGIELQLLSDVVLISTEHALVAFDTLDSLANELGLHFIYYFPWKVLNIYIGLWINR